MGRLGTAPEISFPAAAELIIGCSLAPVPVRGRMVSDLASATGMGGDEGGGGGGGGGGRPTLSILGAHNSQEEEGEE